MLNARLSQIAGVGADSWDDLRQTARKCFTALAGDTSPFVAINAR
jgi:hypothetical protein